VVGWGAGRCFLFHLGLLRTFNRLPMRVRKKDFFIWAGVNFPPPSVVVFPVPPIPTLALPSFTFEFPGARFCRRLSRSVSFSHRPADPFQIRANQIWPLYQMRLPTSHSQQFFKWPFPWTLCSCFFPPFNSKFPSGTSASRLKQLLAPRLVRLRQITSGHKSFPLPSFPTPTPPARKNLSSNRVLRWRHSCLKILPAFFPQT